MYSVPRPTATLEQLQQLTKKEKTFTLFELLMLVNLSQEDITKLRQLIPNYTCTPEKTIAGALACACKYYGSVQNPLFSEALQAQAYFLFLDIAAKVSITSDEPFVETFLRSAKHEFSSLDEKTTPNPSGRIERWNRLIKETIAGMYEKYILEAQADLVAESTFDQVKAFSKSIQFLEPYLKNAIEKNEKNLELIKHLESLDAPVATP